MKVQEHFYINNCMGSFYRGLLNWFGDSFYPEFNYKVIGTFDKAIEYFNKTLENGGEIETNILPSITLDPSGEFEPEEHGGRFSWRYPNLSPGLGSKLFTPIYRDDNVQVTPVFTRFQGTCEMSMWCRSIYEYLDIRTALYMWSGGIGRILRPTTFWSYLVVPEEILDYKYDNDVTGEAYQLDWRSTDAAMTLIKNMDQMRVVYPVQLNPWFQIDSISDGSQKQGGTELASFRLNSTIKYEIELPTYLVIDSDWKLNHAVMNISLGSVHSKYGENEPIQSLRSVAPITPYNNLPGLKQYRIIKSELINFKTISTNVTNLYPETKDIIKWNPITSGRLNVINSSTDWGTVNVGDIIYSETFTNANLSKMRIAGAFITSVNGNNNFIRQKTSLLEKTVITIDATAVTEVTAYDTQVITVDPSNRRILLGEFETEKIPQDEPGYARDILADIEENDPNALNGDTHHLTPEKIFDATADIHSGNVTWRGVKPTGKAIYEFSEEDIAMDATSNIFITLPYEIKNNRDLIVKSYPGTLDYKTHYDIHFDTQYIEMLISPKLDEIVELYFYT